MKCVLPLLALRLNARSWNTARMTHGRSAWRRSRRLVQGGFTLLEMLLACSIMTIALIGVYSTVREILQAEAQDRHLWRDHLAAAAVADLFAQELEGAIRSSNNKLVVVKTDKDTQISQAEWTALVSARAAAAGTPEVIKYRWTWGFAQGSPLAGCVEVQRLVGAVALEEAKSQEDQEAMEATWNQAPFQIVARNVANLAINTGPTGPDAPSQDANKSKSPDQVAVARITVTVGLEAVSRTIVLPVTASYLQEGP